MERKFAIGDKVRLNSGGPVMTIIEYEVWHDLIGALTGKAKPAQDTGMVTCQWFRDDDIKKGKFPQEALQLVME